MTKQEVSDRYVTIIEVGRGAHLSRINLRTTDDQLARFIAAGIIGALTPRHLEIYLTYRNNNSEAKVREIAKSFSISPSWVVRIVRRVDRKIAGWADGSLNDRLLPVKVYGPQKGRRTEESSVREYGIKIIDEKLSFDEWLKKEKLVCEVRRASEVSWSAVIRDCVVLNAHAETSANGFGHSAELAIQGLSDNVAGKTIRYKAPGALKDDFRLITCPTVWAGLGVKNSGATTTEGC